MSKFLRRAYLEVGNISMEDIRIAFKVEKSLVGYPNLAKISVYNLKASNRKLIEDTATSVQLFAGYSDVLPLLFSGDVINVIHLKQKTDWISDIYCGDASTVLNSATINKTMTAGATQEQIFNTLVDATTGLSKGVLEGLSNCLSNKQSLLRGLQLTGNIKDWLKHIAEQCGLDYAITDNVIDTMPKGQPLTDDPVVVINQTTGMIGSPERTDVGLTVKHLLLPTLRLGRRFKVESISTKINVGNLNFRKVDNLKDEGTFRVSKLVHEGDTHGQNWLTTISGMNF